MINPKTISDEELKGECRFCRVSDAERVLAYTENFYVMLSLGPVVEGYLLIVTRDHVDCIADLPLSCIDEFKCIYNVIRNIQIDIYGNVVSYEHGQAGVCASHSSDTKHCHHAHLHMVPSSARVSDIIKSQFETKNLQGWNSLFDEYRENPCFYIMSIINEEEITFAPVMHGIPRQFLRKVVAEHHSAGEKWDWLSYPQWEKITAGELKIREKVRKKLDSEGLLK
ncbi:HIT family protein [Vreelandella salicampi]|uniref:HIT domain-containing protein n=1 Tax=Vreelandella salicampi TaxID=1449798 RepID=A0A7Z0LMD7_9GAMM|nr:hypothetical protein [Halomonas salicampi]NYS61549.1 hypothetical protein [Halomonas salicampi]